jgi:malate synthase
MSTSSVDLRFPATQEVAEILTPQAIELIASLHRTFEARRQELLARRVARQKEIDSGKLPDFLPETKHIRDAEWVVKPIPQDLRNRRVEITGPVDRKMVINALNSGANCFMADFEDANSPTMANNIEGHVNLRDAIRGTISYANPDGRQYKLNEKVATLIVRPRGWHLNEKHMIVDGKQVSGSLFDFALYFLHNTQVLLDKSSGPYFYLPKLESHLEARLWNDVFNFTQSALGFPRGTISVTVLIETILGAFEEDEILWELKDHIVGLNCGRWDYIFSYIKKLSKHPEYMLPDRAQVTMTVPFMRAYALNTIKTCHRRNAYAMGGMAAQIPIKNNPQANESALARVKADKEREVNDGHDGTWVAHPGLVPIAAAAFAQMQGDNQLHRKREDVNVTATDLLKPAEGAITEQGVCMNIGVGVQYLEAWLRGNGCVPLYNLMEDAATAEISRAQVWQWLHCGAQLADGRTLTPELFDQLLNRQMQVVRNEVGDDRFEGGKFELAINLFRDMTLRNEFVEFLTLEAYRHID